MANSDKADTGKQQQAPAWQVWLPLVAILSVGLWAYFPTLQRIVGSWATDPDYSHGYLVVPLALFFLWLRRDRRPAFQLGFHPTWILLLVAAAALRYAAGRFYLAELDAWSLPLWIGGIVGCLWGWPALRWALPSIAFLWFATPLPLTVANAASIPLQKLAATLSGISLQICGLPAIVEGTTILLEGDTLEVERACSGLRMFYGVTALAFASIVIMRPGWWKSIATVLAIAPVAVFTNVLRITATGILNHWFPDAEVEGLIHDWVGLFVLPIAMLAFLGLLSLFDWVDTAWKKDARRVTPWLLGGLATCIVLTLLGVWRYSVQFDRSMTTLLDTAERLEDEGELHEAIGYLNRYTLARPDDIKQQVHLAEVFAEAADSRGERIRAAELLRAAYLADSSRGDLGLQAVDFALETDSYETAIDLVDKMQAGASGADATKLLRKRADVLLAYLHSPAGERQTKYSWADVATALRKSVEAPGYPASHALVLAVITQEHLTDPEPAERQAAADALMNQLVQERPEETEALLARYRYGLSYGLQESGFEPEADLEEAVRHRDSATPEVKAEVLSLAAGQIRQKDPQAAREYLEEAVVADPTAFGAYLALAELARMHPEGDADGRQAAIDVLREGLAANKDEPLPLVFALALQLGQGGDQAEMDKVLQPIRESATKMADKSVRAYAKLGIARAEAAAAFQAGDVSGAIELLQAALSPPQSSAATERFSQEFAAGWRRLATWLSSLGRRDEALAAWQKISTILPQTDAIRAGQAQAAIESGDLQTARDLSRQRVEAEPESSDAWLTLARVLLAEQLKQTADRRNYANVEAALKKASQLAPPRAEFLAVMVDLQRAQGRRATAIETLRQELAANPTAPSLWQILTLLYLETNDLESATEAAEQLAENGGTAMAVAALRANISVAKGEPEKALEQLEASRVSVEGTDQIEFALLSAALHRQLGQADQAVEILERAHQDHPQDLRLLENLAQLALSRQQWAELSGWETKLRGREGEQGTRWKAYRGLRFLASRERLNDQRLNEVAQLAQAIITARPRWAMGPYLLAQAALREGQNEVAVAQLEKAWQLGMQDANTAEQLLALLAAAGRSEEVQRFATQLGDMPLSNQGIFDRVMPSLLGSTQADAALEQSRKWAEESPEDPEALIRLGRALVATANNLKGPAEREKRLSEAEAKFAAALDLAPDELRSWVSLYGFYTQADRAEDAKQLLERLEKEAQLDPMQQELTLAQLNSVAGNIPASVRHWLAATELAGEAEANNKSNVLGPAAGAFARSSTPMATQFAREALAATPNSPTVRFLLVGLLGAGGTEGKITEALEILEEAPDEPREMALQKSRLKSKLLGERDKGSDVDDAIDLMEGIPEPNAGDLRVLAELYEMNDRIGASYELHDRLASMRPAQVADLARYLQFWQKHFQEEGQFDGRAQAILAQLGQLPQGLAEQLRWTLRLSETKHSSDSPPAETEKNDEAPPTPPDNDRKTQEVEDLLLEFWASRPAKQALANPQSAIQLVVAVYRVLLEEQQLTALQKMVEQPPAASIPKSYAARLLSNVLMLTPNRDPAAVELAEQIFDAQIATNPEDVDLLRDAADLASLVGHNERAEEFYQKILESDPLNPAANNNLASLWLESAEKHDQALERVEQCLAEHANDATLHDTRGQILLQKGDAEGALEAVQEAIQLDPSSATAYLHEALALEKLGRKREAQESMMIALALGIENQPKLPADEKSMIELRGRLAV